MSAAGVHKAVSERLTVQGEIRSEFRKFAKGI